jgi:hypothetical protein
MLGIRYREDPHQVYDLILASAPEDLRLLIWVKNTTICYTSSIKSVRLILAVIGDLGALLQVLGRKKMTTVVIREFSTTSLLILWPLYFLLRKKIVLNINHNLSNKWSYALIKRLAQSFRFCLMWGETIVSDIPSLWAPRVVSVGSMVKGSYAREIFVVRSNRDTKNFKESDCIKTIRLVASRFSYSVNTNVDEKGLRIARSEYLSKLQNSSLTVMLHDPGLYRNRHSGTVWDITQYANRALVPWGNVIEVQLASTSSDTHIFHTSRDICSSLEVILR